MNVKKKIGIITFWESNDNYGQQLQCWALQQYLLSIGHSPFLIRVRMFTQVRKKSIVKYALKQIIYIVKETIARTIISCSGFNWNLTKRLVLSLFGKDLAYRRFDDFKRKYIRKSRVFNNYEELKNHPPKADVLIAGSDQIWNADLSEDIWKMTFLQFGDEKAQRIAYAPSMSMNKLSSEQEKLFAQYLHSFDALSAREKLTVEKCKNIGFNCELVLDPTLLITAHDYEKITCNTHSHPYVFIYSINYETTNDIPPLHLLKEIANKDECHIVVTTGGGYIKNEELLNDVIYDYATIQGWIGNIRNAELVVTPSFHGIVFAILFHRNFIFTPLHGRFSKGNERVYDLLKSLDISGHIWGEENLYSTINWENVEKRLSIMRDNSKKYLIKSIK